MPQCYHIFIANSDKNLPERGELELALKGLARSNKEFRLLPAVLPGTDYEQEVSASLAKSHIILPLISVDFMASGLYDLVEPYCTAADKVVMPILAKSCLWEDTPFNHRGQALPDTDVGKAVFMDVWEKGRADAVTDIANGINDIIKHLAEGKAPSGKIAFSGRDPNIVAHIDQVRVEDAQTRKATLWKKRLARSVAVLAVLTGLWLVYAKTTLIPDIDGIEAYVGLSGVVSCGIFVAMTIVFANKLGNRKKKAAIAAALAGLVFAAASGFLYLNDLSNSSCVYQLSAKGSPNVYLRRYVTGPLEEVSKVARDYMAAESGNPGITVASYKCDRLIDEFSVNMVNEIWQPANIKAAESRLTIKLVLLIASLAGTMFALTELALPAGKGT